MKPFKFELEESQLFAGRRRRRDPSAKKNVFPALDGLAMASLRLKPGGIRIPHWHPNAHEMDYVISGKAEIALFGPFDEANPDGIVEHFALEPGDISFLPMGWFHSIQCISHEDLHLLAVFNNASPADIGVSYGLGAMQVEVVAKVLGISPETVREFNTKVHLIAPQ